MTVRERYNYASIVEDITKLLNGEKIRTQVYNAYSRTVLKGDLLTFTKPGILIVEGIPALDIKELRKLSHINVYCEIEEFER